MSKWKPECLVYLIMLSLMLAFGLGYMISMVIDKEMPELLVINQIWGLGIILFWKYSRGE